MECKESDLQNTVSSIRGCYNCRTWHHRITCTYFIDKNSRPEEIPQGRSDNLEQAHNCGKSKATSDRIKIEIWQKVNQTKQKITQQKLLKASGPSYSQMMWRSTNLSAKPQYTRTIFNILVVCYLQFISWLSRVHASNTFIVRHLNNAVSLNLIK